MEMVTSLWKTFRDLVQRYFWIFIVGGLAIRVLYFIYILLFQVNENMWGDILLNIRDGEQIWNNLQSGLGFFNGAKFPFLGGVYVLLIYLMGSGLPQQDACFWFAFSQMMMELTVILAFYFVAKAWTKDINYSKLAVVLWFCNPLWLLLEVIDTDRFGYHPTDYLLIILILLAMYFHTKEGGKKWTYIFLGLTVSVKLFTLPLIALLALTFALNPNNRKQEGESFLKINWVEIKELAIYMGIPIFLTLILPILLDLGNLNSILDYRECSIFGGILPLWIRIIPPAIAAGIFVILLIVKPGEKDLWTYLNWAIIIGAIYWFISQPYLRYFIYPLLIGLGRRNVKKVLIWTAIGIVVLVLFWVFKIGEIQIFVLPGGTGCF